MRIKANDYEVKDVLKIIREWTELTQEELGKCINLGEASVRAYEKGRQHCLFDTVMKIANIHDITVILEKNEK